MTRFVGDAIGVRGRATGAVTSADRRRELDEWRRTGRHPELDAAAASAAAADRPLPRDADAPHVFLQFGPSPSPRLVFQVFEEEAGPTAAAWLLHRVGEGAESGLAGARVSRVDAGVALYLASRPLPGAAAVRSTPRLQHVERGVLGVAKDGSGGLALSLAHARVLDGAFQPLARLVHGDIGVLEKVALSRDGAPRDAVRVVACGRTAARGGRAFEAEAAAASAASSTPVDAAAEAAAAAAAAREAAADAVEEAEAAAAESRKRAAAADAPAPAPKRKTMLDDVLGGSSGSDSGSGSG